MEQALFRERLFHYAAANFNTGLYYDKIYKKEYLPSRIRYNAFFFYAALIGVGTTVFWGKRSGMFAPNQF